MRTKHSEYATAQPESDQRLELAMRDVGDLTDVDVVEVCIHDNTGGRFVWLNKGLASELAAALLEWTKPGWFGRAEKWETTAREATARARELESKLAQALDRSAIIANDYIQLRKVAEHNEKVMDQAIGELKRMAKDAGIELPTPAGQLAACEVSPPAKPLAYIMPPSKENGNANFLLFTYPDRKLVFDHPHQRVVEAQASVSNYQLMAPWDPRHPYERSPAPVPAYPAPEAGNSTDTPVRPFQPGGSVQQRHGNVLHIREHSKWGRYSWWLHLPDDTVYKPQGCDAKFPSLEQAIQWCKRHDFDYRY